VCLELLRCDGWLVSTNKCDKDKGFCPNPLHDEDLDPGPAINVTRRW
jgi:hypothetical protein